jgi:hypothetical protein
MARPSCSPTSGCGNSVLMAGFSHVGRRGKQALKSLEKKEINLQFSRKRWDGGFSVKLY